MIDPKKWMEGGSHKIYLMAMTGCSEEPHGGVHRRKTRGKIKKAATRRCMVVDTHHCQQHFLGISGLRLTCDCGIHSPKVQT